MDTAASWANSDRSIGKIGVMDASRLLQIEIDEPMVGAGDRASS